MKELIRYKAYSRKEIHDIFSPDTNFTPGSGYWGISGIIKVPKTMHDYIFLVTYGKNQANHEFDESIDENGILTWQSQHSQKLDTPQILEFINHDYINNNIYLFLRTDKKSDYTYMGLLAYVTHDNEREKPVYFKWQILDWDSKAEGKVINNHNKIKDEDDLDKIDPREFKLTLRESNKTYSSKDRKGRNTEEFYSNKNINFEGEARKNTKLGNKGEDIIVEQEKRNLINEGRKDLADKVYATRNIAGNAERFDVLSYDVEGNEKYIEVKTTKGGLNSAFHISEREVEFSHQYGDKYHLYRVYNLNEKTKTADYEIVKGPIKRERLKPTNYVCRIGDII